VPLHELHSFDPGITPVRRIWVSDHAADFIGLDSDYRAGKFLDDLDRFITGKKISISMRPRKAKDAFIGILEPAANCIFDFRSRAPEPGLRLIGAFKRKDFFVGLVFRVRRYMNDAEWDRAIAECNELWKLHFQDIPPLTGSDPSVFLTNWRIVD
jgi:hypothetical protein